MFHKNLVKTIWTLGKNSTHIRCSEDVQYRLLKVLYKFNKLYHFLSLYRDLTVQISFLKSCAQYLAYKLELKLAIISLTNQNISNIYIFKPESGRTYSRKTGRRGWGWF